MMCYKKKEESINYVDSTKLIKSINNITDSKNL